MEIYARGLHLAKGYSSMWEMAKKEFKYDNASATRRTNALELALAVPTVLEKIDQGEICLQTAADIQSFLNKERGRKKPYTREQKEELVNFCSGLSCLEVQIELASRNPEMDFKESKRFVSKDRMKIAYTTKVTTEEKVERIRQLLSHAGPYMSRDELTDFMAEKTLDAIDPIRKDLRHEKREEKKRAKQAETAGSTDVIPTQPAPVGASGSLVPNEIITVSVVSTDVSPDPIRLRDEVVSEFGEIQLAIDFDEGAVGAEKSASLSDSVSTLTLASTSLAASKHVSTSEVFATPAAKFSKNSAQNFSLKRSRMILAQDKRDVRKANQDQGCVFTDPVTGRRCGSTHQLQFDHVIEHSRGGSNEASNLRVYCAQYNRFRWRQRSGSYVRCVQLSYG